MFSFSQFGHNSSRVYLASVKKSLWHPRYGYQNKAVKISVKYKVYVEYVKRNKASAPAYYMYIIVAKFIDSVSIHLDLSLAPSSQRRGSLKEEVSLWKRI